MARQQVVVGLDVAVVGKAEVADDALLALLQQEVEDAVVVVAVAEHLHAVLAAADAVQQQVVDVIDLQLLEGVLEHLDGLLARPRGGREVRQLGGDEVLVALVPRQGDAGGVLAASLAVSRGGVEVVDAVLDGLVNQLVDHLLVDRRGRFAAGSPFRGLVFDDGQAHHAVAQQRHLVAGLGVGAVGHLPFLGSQGRGVGPCGFVVLAAGSHGGDGGSGT